MLGDCGYARLSESGFNERFTLCSGRALKKEIVIAGFVGPVRMTHPPVGVIYLSGESEWSEFVL